MSLDGFLNHLVRALRESGVEYMIVGSVAGSYHGRIRSTFDIDIVIDGDAGKTLLAGTRDRRSD